MGNFQTIFKRFEKKYIVTLPAAREFIDSISDYMIPDKYGKSTICNIYFDTPDYRLIRHSMEKGVFKEKLRIRSYNCPTAESNVFVELKKKFKGVVYKRRINMSYSDAVRYLIHHKKPENADEQILKELDYFMDFYPRIRPAVALFYDRVAFYCKDDKNLRITFDTNIRFRTKNLDISTGSEGFRVNEKNTAVMEIKCIGSMPLWLTAALSEHKIFPSSYSKYAKAYEIFSSATEEKEKAVTH